MLLLYHVDLNICLLKGKYRLGHLSKLYRSTHKYNFCWKKLNLSSLEVFEFNKVFVRTSKRSNKQMSFLGSFAAIDAATIASGAGIFGAASVATGAIAYFTIRRAFPTFQGYHNQVGA